MHLPSRITHLLASIYPPETAAACARALEERLARFRTRLRNDAESAHRGASDTESTPPPIAPSGQTSTLQAASAPPAASSCSSWLDQRDALLITYADQVSAPGEPPLRTLAAFARDRLAGVVSGVHLLPFYPWTSDDGFSVKDYFSVDPAYGSWEDIAELGQHFDLMFDAVLNHMSAQSDWFVRYLDGDPAFADFFVSVRGNPDLSAVVRPRALPLLSEFSAHDGRRRVWTTFSADQVDLNFANPAVLLASVDVLLEYAARGARFVRLDAIAFLWKEIGTGCLHLRQTHDIIRLWRALLDEVSPSVQLITETNVPHVDNVRYFGDGTDEAQLVYNFALPPLTLHALQTGDATHLTRWAATLAPPSERTSFFNFLASHDGIGLNPARGILPQADIDALVRRTLERGGFISYKHLPDGSEIPYEMNINYLDALTEPEERDRNDRELALRRFVAAHALMFSLQGMPGIYFHSLFGSQGDAEAARTSGIKRRVNRAKLQRAALETELADVNSIRARILRELKALLVRRRSLTAFAPRASQRILDLDPRVFALVRGGGDSGAGGFLSGSDPVLCLHNLSSEHVAIASPEAGFPDILLSPYEVRWEEKTPLQ